VLRRDDEFQPPENIENDLRDPEDSTMLGEPDAKYHYSLALACLRARRFGELAALIDAVESWPRWTNGDWTVSQAEMLRLAGMPREALGVVNAMAPQPPPMLTQALCALSLGDTDRAAELAARIAGTPNVERFCHPEGRPDALAQALLSMAAARRLDLSAAEKLGRDAVNRDPTCPIARDAWVQALSQDGRHAESLEVLEDGLRRRPGEPRLVEAGVKIALQAGDVSGADRVLQAHRELLAQHNVEATGSYLGELVALARLDAAGASQSQAAEVAWPWINQLDERERQWMGAARMCAERAEMRGGCVLYFAKVAEKALFERVIQPFLKTLDQRVTDDPQYEDIARYLAGGRSPALGGMVRLLVAAAGPFRSAESPLISAARRYLRYAPPPIDGPLFLNGVLSSSLSRLARARNDAAHLEDPTEAEQATAFGLMVDNDGPGLFLRAVGVRSA
jgi:hypothetical protein